MPGATAFIPDAATHVAGIFNGITARTVSRASRVSLPCSYIIKSDGTIAGPASGTVLETWLSGGGAGSYAARATYISGTAPVGTLGSWLPLSSDVSWSLTDSSQGDSGVACTLLVEIGLAGTGVALDSAQITITAIWNESYGGGGGGL